MEDSIASTFFDDSSGEEALHVKTKRSPPTGNEYEKVAEKHHIDRMERARKKRPQSREKSPTHSRRKRSPISKSKSPSPRHQRRAAEKGTHKRGEEEEVESTNKSYMNLHAGALQSECRRLEEQLRQSKEEWRNDLEAAEKRCVDYCDRIQHLSSALEDVREENSRLDTELNLAIDRQNRVKKRADLLESNSVTLRKLVMGYMADPERKENQRRTVAEERFWERLATPELLAASEPPKGFRPPEFVTETDVRRLRTKLKTSEAEGREQLKLIDRLRRNNSDLREAMLKRYNDQRILIRRQETQLMGAVRRIHYLLAEQKKLQERLEKKDHYTFRVEQKLLAQNLRKNRKYRKKKENEKVNGKETKTNSTRGNKKGSGNTKSSATITATPIQPRSREKKASSESTESKDKQSSTLLTPQKLSGKNAAEIGWEQWRRAKDENAGKSKTLQRELEALGISATDDESKREKMHRSFVNYYA
eukprot:g2670.t1